MKIYIDNHSFHYEIENLVRVFFPNDKIETIYSAAKEASKPYVFTSLAEQQKDKIAQITVEIAFTDFSKKLQKTVHKDDRDFDELCELTFAQLIFTLLQDYTGHTPPWGVLTGVRPVKLFRFFADKLGTEQAINYFTDEFFVTKEKAALARTTEKNEKSILDLSTDLSYSLYVSIPFCPSRCSYCSFVSQSIEKAAKLIDPYVDLLCEELIHTANIANALNLRLETVYIGGGTPTTLSPIQLHKLISTIQHYYPMDTCREFTIEAGRPDTITKEKLITIFKGGVDRISINPQTMNDDILKAIGRKHSALQTTEAFHLAREVGFTHINMDLIAGLPNESYESFASTLEQIMTLDPESVTLHTLSMKKASTLTEQGMRLYRDDAEVVADMHRVCNQVLTERQYHPYYLYRQSRMVGNLENIGYAKQGCDGLYNVFIMDETHTIFGCGAGAVTKLKSPKTTYLERIFNYKFPYEYINQFQEMINRKEKYKPFYRSAGMV